MSKILKFLLVFFLVVFVSIPFAQENKTLILEVDAAKASLFFEAYRESPLRIGEIDFRIEPLFQPLSGRVSTLESSKNWFLAKPQGEIRLSGWDLAHYVINHSKDGEVVYAEPDVTPFTYTPPQGGQQRDGYDTAWPYPPDSKFEWHMDDRHSQLKAAKETLVQGGKNVRIAHMDTGYDPDHITKPMNIRYDLQKNFIDGENPNSAVDLKSEGLLNYPGHGTATIGILAGNKVSCNGFNDYLGGAPFAEIVPIRLSKTVILFQSSALVKAFYYIVRPEVKCDVISMSMGGVASKYWADAVNDVYNQGVTVVTAAGNNIGLKPTRYTVYPARFKRVISACGAVYDDTPYFKYGLFSLKMQGNYGPDHVMPYSIAAYTPNVPWALIGTGNQISLSGAGTSAATPQVAAAAALWIQKYDRPYDYPWQRVNAVMHALYSSADKKLPTYFGNGILKASKALQIAPKIDSTPLPKDEVSSPWLTLLLGWRRDSLSATQKMMEVEMAQLEQNNLSVNQLLGGLDENTPLTEEEKAKIKETIIGVPSISNELSQALSE